jgi:PTS system mannose-specific IIA component
MIGVVICTHLNLAQALIETLEMIVGELPAAEAVCVRPGDSQDDIRRRLGEAIAKVDDGDGVVVLCDMFGGTPANLAIPMLSERVEVVTGVNLPMLLKLYTHRDRPLAEVATSLCEHARQSIHVAGDFLRGAAKGGGA